MSFTLSTFAIIFAQAEGEIQNFPLPYQIICIILTAFFLWTFSIARDPRGWRRLYQAKFAKKEDFSVNKNKKFDETIKKYGILIAMGFLVADVTFFVLGVTHKHRANQRPLTKEEQLQRSDMEKYKSGSPKENRKSGL
jgi:hypothetical protein